MKDARVQNGDLLIAASFVAFGGFVIFEALRMPYWERDTFMMSPGIVPLFAGAALSLLGVMYGIRAWWAGAGRRWGVWGREIWANEETKRVLVLLGLLCLYGVGLVGRVPFFLATLVFHGAIFAYLRIGGWVKWIGFTLGATLFVAWLLPRLFEMPLPGAE